LTRAVVLISGRGSNMEALLRAGLPVDFACVISNKPEALGLAIARESGIATAVVDHRVYPDRIAFDAALAEVIDRHAPDLVILAGFMRVLTEAFVRRYTGRMINVHPALLPAFPGLHTHRRALDAGVKVHGCTVHFVTPEVDVGPIVVQAAVPVLDHDTEDSLAARPGAGTLHLSAGRALVRRGPTRSARRWHGACPGCRAAGAGADLAQPGHLTGPERCWPNAPC
jgi:phosphoribosylglycinamide formyltransferase 1